MVFDLYWYAQEGGDDGGKWLPKLVARLIAEEDSATGAFDSADVRTQMCKPSKLLSALARAGADLERGKDWASTSRPPSQW